MEELPGCLQAVTHYKNATTEADRRLLALNIYRDFIRSGSRNQVNIASGLRADLERAIGGIEPLWRDLFAGVEKELKKLARDNFYIHT